MTSTDRASLLERAAANRRRADEASRRAAAREAAGEDASAIHELRAICLADAAELEAKAAQSPTA